MKVEKFMKKDVVTVGPEDRIHKVLEKMRINSIKQILIEKDGKYAGFISLDKLMSHGFGMEHGKAKNFSIKNIALLDGSEDEHEAARKLISSGVKALPVIEDNKIKGIVGEEELLEFVEKSNIEKLANECITANKKDKVSKIENLMAENNISRVPIQKDGKIVGIVNNLDLARVAEGDQQMEGAAQDTIGERMDASKEMERRGEAPAEAIMQDVEKVYSADVDFKTIKREVKNKGYILISNRKKKIITERDFVERLSIVPQESVYVQITNLQEEDAFVKRKIDDAIREFLQGIGKRLDNLESFFMHIKRHGKSGKQTKYSVRTKFQTPIGLYVSRAWDWDLPTASQKALSKLDKMINKDLDKLNKHPKKK